MRRYTTDRFVAPAAVSYRAIRHVEDATLAAGPTRYETISLAPLVPLGTHSAIATVAQNKVVTTIRSTETAADPTNALTLEASVRRATALRIDPKSDEVSCVAASQGVVRAQHVVGPRNIAHFQSFGLATAGRDCGGRALESEAAAEHALIHARSLIALGAAQVAVALTDFSGGGCRGISDAVRRALAELTQVTCVDDPERAGGSSYYQDFCFKVHGRLAGTTVETSDGGIVDWTQRLVGSAKERCFINGIGIDRLALVAGSP